MADIPAHTAQIEAWGRDQCLDAWEQLHGQLPGARLSLKFLRRALIFEKQSAQFGGHTAAVRRVLKSSVSSPSTTARPTALPQGTQLVREWNGRIYRVDVVDEGFEMDGTQFSSLSAIAKRITGAQWSGPRFFGLIGKSS